MNIPKLTRPTPAPLDPFPAPKPPDHIDVPLNRPETPDMTALIPLILRFVFRRLKEGGSLAAIIAYVAARFSIPAEAVDPIVEIVLAAVAVVAVLLPEGEIKEEIKKLLAPKPAPAAE